MASTLLPPATALAQGSGRRVVVPHVPEERRLNDEQKQAVSLARAAAAGKLAQGELGAALDMADEAFRMAPSFKGAMMRVEVLSRMGRRCAAFEVALAAMRLAKNDVQRKEAGKALAGLAGGCKPALGWAHVRVLPRDAKIRIGGRTVRSGDSVGLSPGVHTLLASARGRVPRVEMIEVGSLTGKTLKIKLAARKEKGQTLTGAVLFPSIPTPAADDQAEAATAAVAVEMAEEKLKKGDIKTAAELLDGALRVAPDSWTYLLKAQVAGQIDQGCDATAAALLAADLAASEEERVAIDSVLEQNGPTCAPGLGWLHLKIQPFHATADVSGTIVPSGRTVGVIPGRHIVTAGAAEYSLHEEVVEIKPGEGRVLDIRLRHAPPPPRPTASTSHLRESAAVAQARRDVWGWGLVGAGGAMILGGFGTHMMTLSAIDETDAVARPSTDVEDPVRRARYDDHSGDARVRRALTYSLYGLGGAALGAGLFILLQDVDEPEAAGARLTPLLGPDGAGLSIGGGF